MLLGDTLCNKIYEASYLTKILSYSISILLCLKKKGSANISEREELVLGLYYTVTQLDFRMATVSFPLLLAMKYCSTL